MNRLQFKEIDTSKLPDKSLAESTGDLAPRTEVILEKHSTDLVEASGKRSWQREFELPDKSETKRYKPRDSRTAKRKVSEAASLKNLNESIHEGFGKKIRQYGEVSDKMLLVEVDGSLTNPGKVINCQDDPASAPVAQTLNNNSSLTSQKENSDVRRKLRKMLQSDLPCRCSKRLAGQQSEAVNHLVSTLRAPPAAAGKSSKGRLDAGLASYDLEKGASPNTLTEVKFALQGVPLPVKSLSEVHELPPVISLGSDVTHHLATEDFSGGGCNRNLGTGLGNFVNGAPLHVGASSEVEDFFDTLEDISSVSHESLNSSILLLDDQMVNKELHQNFNTEENPEMLSFQFRDVPCYDFAYKILTGELPISYAPNLEQAADNVQKEKTLRTGSGSRNATSKACSSKVMLAVDLAPEASHQYKAIEEKNTATDPCNITGYSGHGESSNKIDKSLANQTFEEKAQIMEFNKVSVENHDEEFTFPILPDILANSDPFFGLAFQSAKEDNLFMDYFQHNHDTIYNEVNTPAQPFFFESDITPQFDTTGAYVPVFPENSFWPRADNVNQTVNPSFQPAGNEGFSSISGVGSDQQISMNASSFPAGTMPLPSLSGVAAKRPSGVAAKKPGRVAAKKSGGVAAKKSRLGKLKE